jgi:hypothetical protein
MARLLTFLMILALVMTQGTAMAAALCRHQNAQEHVLARQSKDAETAAVSIREDAASAAAAKKASQSADAGSWPAELLPAELQAVPAPALERLRLRPAEQAALPSATVLPLLKPPSA